MKKHLSGLAAIAGLVVVGLAQPAAAAIFCGAGYVTSLGEGFTFQDPNYAPQIYFKIDNSIAAPPGNVVFTTVNGSGGWMQIYDNNDPNYQQDSGFIQKAFLAGTPIKVFLTQGTACGDMSATNSEVQICASANDCTYSGTP